jgi:hypothetical protein
MKSLLWMLLLGAALYVAWDLFGDGVRGRVSNAADSAKGMLSGVTEAAEEGYDFVMRYDGVEKKFTMKSRHEPEMNVRAEVEVVRGYLHTPHAEVPRVLAEYDASAFVTAAEQAAFEAEVRRQVEGAPAQVHFRVRGRPRSL